MRLGVVLVWAAVASAQPYPGAVSYTRLLPAVETRALATAADGSTWVGGFAKAGSLPVTTNAIQPQLDPSTCGVVPGAAQTPNLCGDAYFARFARDGSLLYGSYLGGSGQDELAGLAVAANGDVYILGLSRSATIDPGRGPFVLQLHADGSRGFVRSLAPDPDVTPVAIALSNDGVYIAGHSGGAGFVTKLDAATGGVIFSRTFGAPAAVTVAGLAVDPAGNAYVTGITRSADFPATAGAWKAVAPPTPAQTPVFVVEIAAAGDRVIAAAEFGGESFDLVDRIAIGPTGDVYLAGTTGSRQFPLTSGAMQSEWFGGNNAWVVRLRGDLSAPVYSTFLHAYSSVAAIFPAADGSAVLLGSTQSYFFPVTADAVERCPTPAYIGRLGAEGSRLLYASFLSLPFQEGTVLSADLRDRDISIAVPSGIELVSNSAARPTSRLCAVNSASFAPLLTYTGEYVTIFGGGLAPKQVLVNGTPAELVYVSAAQVNILVPPLAAARTLHIDVEGAGAIDIPAVERAPGLFRVYGTYGAAALNDDGSMNGPAHPARPGAGLTFFGTGFGPAPAVKVYFDQTEAPVRTVVDDRGLTRIEVTAPDLPPGRYPVFFQTDFGFQAGFVEVTAG